MRKILICCMAFIALIACRQEKAADENAYSDIKIRMAAQYGMQYAPAYVMVELDLLQKYLPGVQVEWTSLGGGAAINEALLSRRLDVAYMGLPPALIGWNAGADYKIASGISVPPSELMVKDNSIETIADFKPEHKIAVPGVGSIQHIMLAMASKKYLDDPKALDINLMAMANPDAYASLISGTEVIGHFASMPYLDMEQAAGLKSILSGKDAFGEASIVCVSTKSFHDDSPLAYAALIQALSEAVALINARDERAVNVIAEVEKLSVDTALKYLDWPGTNYTTTVHGALELGQFMADNGFIGKAPTAFSQIMWDSASAMLGMPIK